MERSVTDVLAALNRSPTMIDAVLRQTADPGQRAARLAEMLRLLWPSLPLYACLFAQTDRAHGGVVDEASVSRPEWEEVLQSEFARREPPGAVAPGDRDGTAKDFPLPRALGLLDHVLVAEAFVLRCHGRGLLAVALPNDRSAEMDLAARTLLSTAGRHLASGLNVESLERECKTLRGEAQGETALAHMGELAGPVLHEVNNFLNTLLLEVAILEATSPERSRAHLVEIRRQGKEVTTLIKQFQQYRHSQWPAPQAIDLNQVVAEAVEALSPREAAPEDAPSAAPSPKPEAGKRSGRGVRVEWTPAPHLPPVLGNASNLKRLFFFLLKNAAAAEGPRGGPLVVRTHGEGRKVRCAIDDTGPVVPADLLPKLFELGIVGREETNSLELAVCKTILRRFQGKIEATNRPEGGLTVTVELPAAPA